MQSIYSNITMKISNDEKWNDWSLNMILEIRKAINTFPDILSYSLVTNFMWLDLCCQTWRLYIVQSSQMFDQRYWYE